MKKLIAVILTLVMVFALTACDGKELTPIEKAQQKAVEIGEQFLNFELTADEAREKLEGIRVPEPEEGHGKLYLECDIDALSFAILTDESYEELEERVDSIRKQDYTK